MVNLALFNESFAPQFDGVAITVENYARIINEIYGKSYVIAPSHPERECSYPYPIWEYKSAPISIADQYRVGIPISAKLAKKFHKTQIDIVHSHCPFTSGLLAQKLSRQNNIPHIATFHSKYKEDIDRRLKINFNMPGEIVAKYIAGFYAKCDYIWTVSQGTANTLREYGYKGEITVMPNGCDMPITQKNDAVKNEIFTKYKLDVKVPLLLFVGRLTFMKNTDIIIEALGALARQNIRFNMLFVGEGEDKKSIQKMVEKQDIYSMVKFTGKVMDRELLKKIYTSGDLLLFPSVYDNAPLVVREAAACGCASVLIRGSNSAEGLIDGHNAFLSKETTEDFALTINAALGSCRIREVGQNARKDIYISWYDVLDMVNKEYLRILEEWNGKNQKKNIH